MIIKGGLVFQNNKYEKLDIQIIDKKITKLAPEIVSNNEKTIDAKGKIINPGFVDVHVHFREPGQTKKETILTGSLAAAHGGYTTVGAMPNVIPVPDTLEKFQQQQQLNQQSVINLEQFASITTNEVSDELVDFKGLQKMGAFAFSNDGHGISNSQTMYQAMKEIAQINSHLVAHIEDEALFNRRVINEGKKSHELNLIGIPEVAETAQLARDLILVEETGVHYHACHISTKKSLDLIRQAKAKGLNVTCEVTPHHLLLNEDDIKSDNAMYKMNPPLRTKKDQEALITGLQDGTIDMIATDHAPHTLEEKSQGFSNSCFGISGIETSFSLIYTGLVQRKIISLEKLVELLAIKPAQIFKLTSTSIKLNQIANLNIIDINNTYKIDVQNFQSKGKNTPFDKFEVTGKVIKTICNGEVVYGG